MRKFLTIFTFLILAFKASGQDCTQNNLSNFFEFKTHLTRIHTEDLFDSCIVEVKVYDKLSKKIIQKIEFSSTYFFDKVFNDCNNVRSYVTGNNQNADVEDNDFGDLIVADFNFDKKDDIALKENSGGNGGPTYIFYIQNDKRQFQVESFLSERMDFFPSRIDPKKRTLTTLVHANAYEMSETTYKLNADKVWTKVKRRYVKY
jgi:hypothetical protein